MNSILDIDIHLDYDYKVQIGKNTIKFPQMTKIIQIDVI